ncbi:MAG: LpxI family protein [Zetaproteobacteria bacterium]|nr:MAG: LpxI family protein [Zetaproteobacteria bacterium]
MPRLAAEALRRRGVRVVAAAVREEADAALAEAVDEIRWLSVGQLGAARRFFAEQGCQDLVMAGKVRKVHLFRNFRPDLDAMGLLWKLKDWRDATILSAIVRYFEERGFRWLSQLEIDPALVAPQGAIAGRAPDAKTLRWMQAALAQAKALAGMEIGQTIVVKQGTVLAVEAAEGTDEAIRRGGRLGGGEAIVVKAARPDQDPRFDVPGVGVGTIRAMAESGCRWLAVEAGMTLLLERERMVEEAARASIGIYGLAADGG